MANAKQCDRCKEFYICKETHYPFYVTSFSGKGYDLCSACADDLEVFMSGGIPQHAEDSKDQK